MRVYRLTLPKYADRALSGEGARRVGSRWTPIGYPAIFTASSIALAVLETLVHTDLSIMPRHRVLTIDVPDELSRTTVDSSQLPEDWQSSPPPPSLQMIGKSWLDSGETALLQVPSAIVPQEWNLILNLLHAKFSHLVIDTDQAFDFDPRLRAPILEASELPAAGERLSAQKLLVELLAADLRCLDAHAHLGNFAFDRPSSRAGKPALRGRCAHR